MAQGKQIALRGQVSLGLAVEVVAVTQVVPAVPVAVALVDLMVLLAQSIQVVAVEAVIILPDILAALVVQVL